MRSRSGSTGSMASIAAAKSFRCIAANARASAGTAGPSGEPPGVQQRVPHLLHPGIQRCVRPRSPRQLSAICQSTIGNPACGNILCAKIMDRAPAFPITRMPRPVHRLPTRTRSRRPPSVLLPKPDNHPTQRRPVYRPNPSSHIAALQLEQRQMPVQMTIQTAARRIDL